MGGGKGGSSDNSAQMLQLQQQQMAQQLEIQRQQVEDMEKMRQENNIQKSKTITEATSGARQAQREKATKASGIRGTILTDPMGINSQEKGIKTMLGK